MPVLMINFSIFGYLQVKYSEQLRFTRSVFEVFKQLYGTTKYMCINLSVSHVLGYCEYNPIFACTTNLSKRI